MCNQSLHMLQVVLTPRTGSPSHLHPSDLPSPTTGQTTTSGRLSSNCPGRLGWPRTTKSSQDAVGAPRTAGSGRWSGHTAVPTNPPGDDVGVQVANAGFGSLGKQIDNLNYFHYSARNYGLPYLTQVLTGHTIALQDAGLGGHGRRGLGMMPTCSFTT